MEQAEGPLPLLEVTAGLWKCSILHSSSLEMLHSAKGDGPKGLQAALLQAPSTSFPQPFPSCSKPRSLLTKHHRLTPHLLPQTLFGAGGSGKVASDRLFRVLGRQHPSLEGSSPSTRLPPGLGELSCPPPLQDQLCLFVLHVARQGNCKKVAERIETRR